MHLSFGEVSLVVIKEGDLFESEDVSAGRDKLRPRNNLTALQPTAPPGQGRKVLFLNDKVDLLVFNFYPYAF